MKAMLAAFVACGVIAAAAPPLLTGLGYTAEATRAGDNVRLGDTSE